MDVLNINGLGIVQDFMHFYNTNSTWKVFERFIYFPLCFLLFVFNMRRIYVDYLLCKKYPTGRKPLYKRFRFVVNSVMMSIPYIHVWWLMVVSVIMAWRYMFDPE